MHLTRYRLRTLLILAAAAPIWIFLIVALPQSPGFAGNPLRLAIVPLALFGISAAIYRLTRTLVDGPARRAGSVFPRPRPLPAEGAYFKP